MGKKSKCCQKLSSSVSCGNSSSSSSSSSLSCSSSLSSSYGYCCPQYPKCKGSCYKNKCAPIYYPNNYVGQYPSGQYPSGPCPPKPCPPYPCSPYPCPPYPCGPNPCGPNPYPPNPCNPTQCSPFYNTFPNTITPSSTSTPSINNAYTLYLVNPTDASGNIVLPGVTAFVNCCYNKMFVFTNISSTNSFVLATTGTDLINGLTSIIIPPNTSVTLYSSYVGGIGYWSLVGLCNIIG